MKKLVISCFTLILCLSAMAQNATLKMNLEKNKIYRFKSSSDQTVSQTVNGVQQTTNSSTHTVFSIKMVDAAADFIVAEVRFDTMLTNTNAMGKMTVINSAMEGNMASEEMADVMSCVMNRLSKNPIYTKMDGTGKVVEIMNLKMLSDIIMKDTASITGQMAPVLKTQIKNTISNEALKSMIEMFTYNLPGKEVKAGDRWDLTVALNSGGMALDIATNNKLDEIKGNNADITSESTIKAAANAPPLEYSGAKITYDGISGMGKSSLTINTITGLIVASESKTHMTGDLNVSVQGMSMQIPMEIDSQSSVNSLQ